MLLICAMVLTSSHTSLHYTINTSNKIRKYMGLAIFSRKTTEEEDPSFIYTRELFNTHMGASSLTCIRPIIHGERCAPTKTAFEKILSSSIQLRMGWNVRIAARTIHPQRSSARCRRRAIRTFKIRFAYTRKEVCVIILLLFVYGFWGFYFIVESLWQTDNVV